MSVQIAKGLQVFGGNGKEVYIEVAEGQYVSAKLGETHTTGNLKNTCGKLIMSKAECAEFNSKGYAYHPRGRFLYDIDEVTRHQKARKIMVRWDNETGRLC